MVKRRAFFPFSEEDVVCGEELKPCPCCGSERTYRNSILMESGKRFFTAYCLACGIRTRTFLDVRDAEKAWNRRCSNDARQPV